jgi:NADPH-dependent ferric siderophore reductase
MSVTVALDSPSEIAGVPGNDVMVRLEDSPGHFVRRRYSVRSVDELAGTISIWVTTAHDGPGSRWASSVTAGDVVDLIGPRGKIVLDSMADWHLFVGDTSALGAFYRLAESIDPPGQAIFVVEVESPDDVLTPVLPEGIGPTGIFVDRRDRARGDASGLLNALAVFEFPEGDGHAYLFGEFHCMKAVRAALVDRGLETEQIDLKAFWRAGVANQEHGEPPKDE